jgi:HPt (histidine-containing phosphotransfer) domain-containing protein
MVRRVRAAVAGDSSEEIRQAAHAFKGAVGNLTRVGAMETAARLEAVARGESTADVRALMALLEQQTAGLLDELKAVRAPSGPCEF